MNKQNSQPMPYAAASPRLDIPNIDASRKPRPYFRPKALQTWVAELPIGNTIVAAHQCLEKLRQLNAGYYPVKERLLLLSTLRPLLQQLSEALKQPIRQARLPLDAKSQYNLELMQKLLDAMAIGYKLIVAEMARLNPAKLKTAERMLLQEACYLATVYLSYSLIETYSVYAQSRKLIWLDLNQIFQFAESRQLHTDPVDEPFPDTPLPVQHSVDFAYKRIVLLALAEPYHLMEFEVEDLFRLIAPSATTCGIDQMSLNIPEGTYVIDLNADSGPRFISANSPWQATDGRQIDISAVKNQLEVHLQRLLRANIQQPQLEATSLVERQYRDMLLRLADAWNGSLVRRIQRFKLEGKVQLAAGLNACHHFIMGENEFTPAMDELKLLTQHQARIRKDERQSIFATAYRDALQRDRRHNLQNFALNPWWQRNISPIGIALNCQDACERMETRVGELVGYRFTHNHSHRWRIGVIRWLQIHTQDNNEGQVHIGIMNIATGAVPVGTKGISGLGTGTDYFRGLFIPKQVALDQSRSLIVPALIYDINSVLAVNMKEKLFHVRLVRLRLSTRSFVQFDFEIVSGPRTFTIL